MDNNIYIIVQLRGPSPVKNGILTVGIKDKSKCKRISFKKTKTRIKNQEWDDQYKKNWATNTKTRDALIKLEMEAYEPEKACTQIKEYFSKMDSVHIYAHPEDIAVISFYIDFHLEEPGFFRSKKFIHHAINNDKSFEAGIIDDMFIV